MKAGSLLKSSFDLLLNTVQLRYFIKIILKILLHLLYSPLCNICNIPTTTNLFRNGVYCLTACLHCFLKTLWTFKIVSASTLTPRTANRQRCEVVSGFLKEISVTRLENITQEWTSFSSSRVCPDCGTESPKIQSAGQQAYLVILNHGLWIVKLEETLPWVMEQTENSRWKLVECHTLEG